MSRVVLAMSGGVDSSVAAHLLIEQGHDVIGVFMRHGEQSPVASCELRVASCEDDEGKRSEKRSERSEERGAKSECEGKNTASAIVSLSALRAPLHHKQGCCTASDAEDARRVADRLGIPFYALNLQAEFVEIIDYFVSEYVTGRTPNPCVQCNNWIKFGKLFDYADGVGAEFVATGHYARMERDETGDAALLRGIDPAKDQSYVLFGIRRELLGRMMLPVGGYEKPAIRKLAAGLGLRVAEKKDSQEICFVTSGRYDQFVRGRGAGGAAGEIVTTEGTVVGEHSGIEGFTVGQRKGLGVALGDRKFVVRIEPESRRVVLGDREELNRYELTAANCNWLREGVATLIDEPRRCFAQIRYNATAQPASMTVLAGGRLHVRFDTPQFAVTPGQAVVCYGAEQNARVLGGGWIE
ncbi:MAG: tRNA 2-thiouridine(34) synthase MnmA [Pirellulales bacterium]|nr:tRNA 2-thiouridine(34) synthase MnmA [Pirellulales bacterium]